MGTDRSFEDSSFSKLRFSIFIIILKIRVPTQVFHFYIVWSFEFRLELPIGFNARVGTYRSFENSSFSKLEFSIFIIILKIWVPTRVFPFYVVWSFEFRLELPIGFNARVGTDRSFEDSSFSKLGFSIFIIILKIRVPTQVFPFYIVWSFEFRLELSIRFNARVGTDRSFVDSCFSKLGFSIFIFILKIRVPTRVFPFYVVWSFEFRLELPIGFNARVGTDRSFENSSFQNSSFQNSSFQNSSFPFLLFFWRSGFRLGFSLFYVVWGFEFRIELPIGFNARVGTDRSFEDSSFSKLGFSIFIFIFILKIRVPTQVFLFISFEVSNSDSNFLSDSTLVLEPVVPLKIRVFKTRVFHFYYYFEDPGSDSGFPFLCRLKFRVSSRTFYRVQRSCWNRSFLWKFEFSKLGFSKLGFSIFIIILKIRVPTRVFPFYVVWSFEFRLELPIGFNARVGTDRSFEDSSFSKLGFSIFIIILKIRVPTQVFPFYIVWSFEFRLELPIRFNARVGTDRSFVDSSFSKLGFSIFIFILKIRVPTRVFPFYVVWSFEFRLELPIGFNARVGTDRSFEDSSFQNSGFPFLLLFWRSGFRLRFSLFMSFEVSSSDSNFLSDSTLVLEPIVPLIRVPRFEFFKTRSVGTDRSFENFFIFIFIILKIRVPTRVFPFLCRLKFRVPTRTSYRIQRSCWNRSFLWRFEFSKLGFSIFIIILKIRVPTRVFPFYVIWSFEFRLELPIGFNARVGTDRFFEDLSFQNSGFPFLLLFWRSGFRLGFSLFMSFEVSSSDSNFLSDSTLVLEPIVPLKIRVFQNSGFSFLLLFWRSGFRLGFSLFMSFEVSSSDWNFLSDSTLVLEPIVPLKIRVFKTRVFHFYYYFEDPGSDSGFPFLCRLKFRVPTRTSYRIQRSCWNRSWRFFVFHFYFYFEDSSFQNSGFPFLLLFWRSEFRLGFSLFMSFEVSSSDSNFLSDSTLVLEPIVPLKIRVFQNSGFPFLLLFWRSGFRLGFSFLCRLKFRVPTRTSYRIQRSCWNRSFLWKFEFSKLGFSIFIIILKIRVPTRVFPFYVVWSFEFRLELPIGFNARVGTDRSFEDSSFSKLGFSIFIIILKIRVPTRVFPFYVVWSFEFRLELPIGFNARVGTDRSFEDSSFSKLGFSIFIIILKIRVPTRVFPFYVIWSFEFRLELPIGFNARVGTDRFFEKISKVFKTRVFHFYYYFEDPGSDSGFPFLCRLKFRVPTRTSYRIQRSCWNRSFLWIFEFSKLRFFIFIIILKIRVPTRVFPFYVVWSFEFRLELPIRFNARVGTDRSFENSSFQNSGFPFLLLFWRSGFRLGFSLFMSFEVSSSDSNFLSDSTLVLEPIVPLKIRVFQNSGFPFLLLFWRSGFRLGFSLFMSFEVSSSDSNFLSDSTLVLEPIVPLKIRVFQNSGFSFLLLFWRSGFRLGFSLFMSFEVLSSDSNFLSDSTLVLEPIVPLKIRVFQNSGFPFLFLFWRSGFRLGFSLFMSFEVSSSDSNFLSDSTLVLEPIVPLKIRVFKTRVFHFYYYFEDPGSDSGFPFLCCLKFRVPTRTSYRIQRSCWNRSFLWRFEFSKLGFSIFIIILKIRVPTRVFPFYVVWSFEFRLELPIGFNARVGTDRSFEDSSFSKLGFFIFIFILKIGFRLRFSLFMSFEVSSSDSNFLSDSTLVLEPIVPLKIRVFQNSGFPFLLLFWRSGFRLGFSLFMSFEVSSSDSNFLSDSTLVLEPIVPLKIRVFQNSGFPFLLLFWRSGFRLGFSFLCRLKFRVPTRTSLSDSTLVLEPIVPLKIRVFQNSGFPFLLLFWRSGFRLGFSLFMSFEVSSSDSNFLSDSTLVLEPIVPLKIRVFQNSGFPFLLLFWRSGFRLGFSLFMSFEVSSSDSNFLSDSTLVLEPIVPLKIRVFQNSGFPFLLLFWRSGFRLGFSLFMSFEVSSSDSNFLSDSTLVLEPIVPLKIRVFQNSGFPFLLLFWRSGFRLGFSLFMSFEVSSFDSNFLSDSTLVLEPIVPLKIRVFQNSGFPFLLLFWRFGFRLRFFLFISFEVSSSDSNFLSDSTLVLEPIVPLKIRVFQNSGFPFLFLFLRSGSDSGFPFLCRLKFRVPTRTSYRIQRSCWNRSFLWKFEFSKLGFSIFIIILKIRVPTRVFPFYVVWSFEFRLELPIGFNARVGTDRSFENSSFQNSGFPFLLLFWRSGFRLEFSHFMSFEVSSSDSNFLSDSTLVLEPIVPLKIRVFQNSGFPFLLLFWRSGFRLGFSLFMSFEVSSSTQTSYRIQRSCWNRSFLWKFEFSKLGFSIFIIILKIRVPTQVFPFYVVWSFEFRLELPIGFNARVGTDRSFEDSSFSKLGFSIFIFILKIRVPTRVFPFYVVWSFEFRLELPIRFKARVGTDRSFENSSFQNSGFPLGFSHFYYYFEDLFPFLCRLKFRVSNFLSDSTLVLEPIVPLKIRVFQNSSFPFLLLFWSPSSDSGFPFLWRFEFRLKLPIGFNARVGTDRSFEDSSFSKLRFSIFIIILKIRVPTQVFPFYVVWSFEFRLELPIGFNARVGTDRSFEDSSFSKLGFSIFIIILKIRVPTRVFPFYVIWSFEFRLELPIGFNARVGTDRSFENSSFQNSGFPFLLLFWRSGFRLGFSLFMSFEVSSSDSNFLSDSTLVLEPIVPLKIRVFQNSGFPFLLLFWRSGFRLRFSLFMSFEVSSSDSNFLSRFNARVGTDRSFEDSSFSKLGFSIFIIILKIRSSDSGFSFFSFEVSSSDSNFLSDSTLVLEPIVTLKIRVFKIRVFHFYYLFWRSGFRLGFSLFMSFEVSSSDSNFLSDSTLVLEPIVPLKIRVFQNSGFPFLLLFWRSGFRLGFSLFMSFEVSSSDSNFLSDSTLVLEPIVPLKIRVFKTRVFHFYYYFEDSGSDSGFSFLYRLKFRVPTRTSYQIQRSCWNRSFLCRFEFFKTRVFHFYFYFEDPGSDSGFPFLCRLKFRVPTRTSYRIQRSCWNRSFLWRFEFSKLGFSIFIIILKIRVPTRVFPFYVVWSFEFRLELPIGFNACWNRSFLWRFEFFKTRVFHSYYYFEDSSSDSGFSYLWRLKIRVLTQTSYQIQRSCWNRSFLGRFEFFKTQVFHFYFYFEDPGSDSGFPFLCRLKFRVPTRTSYRIQRSCWNRSFLWRFEFFKTRVFHFYYYFEDPGSDSGFPFLCRLKFRVPTRTSYRIQRSCWNRSFLWKIRVFQNSGFPFLLLFWRSGFRLGFSLFMSFEFRVPTRTSYRIQRSCWNRSFLWRFEFFKTRVFHFYYYFEDSGSDSGFSFLYHLKFRVPTRTSYRIQRSCWNRSFLWDSSFSKLGFSIFIIILKIRVPTRVFPFYVVWSFEFRLENSTLVLEPIVPLKIFQNRVFHFYYYFEDPGSDSGFPFLCRLKFRVPTRTSYRIQRSCWNRSFLWRFEFFKTRVFHFYYYFEDPGSDSGFPFLCRLKFRVPTRTSYRIQRSYEDSSGWNRLRFFLFIRLKFLWTSYRIQRSCSIVPLKIRVFQNSGFPFLLLFWRSGFRLGFSLFMSFEVSSSDSNFLSDSTLVLEPIVPLKIRVFKTRVFHFYYYFEDPGSDSGFPFLCRLKFRVPIRTSYRIQRSCWNRSFFWRFEFFKTRVFHFYYYFEDSGSDSGFSFLYRLKFRVPTRTSYQIQRSCWNQSFLCRFEFFKTRVFHFYFYFEDPGSDSGFPFLCRLKFRVPTRTSYRIQRSCWNRSFLWRFEFFKTRVFHFYYYFEDPGSDSGFSFLYRLKFRVPTRTSYQIQRSCWNRSFLCKIRVFQNSGFPFLFLFWRSGFRLGFSLFMSFEVSSSDSNFLSDSTLVLEPIVPLKIRVFKTRVFHFYFYFEDPGSDSGFSLFMSFEVSSSDSNFLSDSTLVLEPIVPLKIRVFQNSGFPFLLLFWRSGFRLGFSLFMSFEVSSSDSNFLSDSTLVLEPIVPLKIRVFKTRVFHFYYYFEDPGSDSGFPFLCRLKFRVPTRTSYRIQRSCWNRSFLWRFEFFKTRVFHFYYYFEDPGSDSGFPFLCRLKFRVPTRTSYRIQRSCWNRSFLWRFEFFKTRVFHFYYYFEDPGSDSGFSFLCRLKFRVPTRTSYRIQRSCWNRSFLWRFEFFKTRVFHFYYYFEDPGSDSGFPFLCRLKFRVPTRTSYRIQRSCWNRSFLWRFEFFKTRVFHFYYYFEDPGSDSGFSFLCRLKFRVPTRTSYRIQRSCWNRSFLWRFEFFKTRVFHFYFYFEDPGSDSGFPFLCRLKFRVPTRTSYRIQRSCWNRSFLWRFEFSKLGFSIFIIILKIRVPTRVFPFYVVWSFEFRLELPIGFNARVGTDRSFEDSSFSKLGFSIFIIILKIRVPTRVFPFYVVWSFEFRLKLPIRFNARVGTDRSFEDSSFSKLGFSIFIIILKIRVPTQVFPFYIVWSFEFRLELPIGFNARVGTDRSFENCFQNSGFPFLLLFWRSGFRLGFSLFMSLKIRVPTRTS